MGLTVLPTNIGGVNLNSITNPLASLFSTTNTQNLVYPSDLATNPAMCHAIQFSVYDYTTGLREKVNNIDIASLGNNVTAAKGLFSGSISALNSGFGTDAGKAALAAGIDKFNEYKTSGGLGPAAASAFTATEYLPRTKGKPLANISLYMPDSLNATYDSHYSEVSMTTKLGFAGLGLDAISEIAGKSKEYGGYMNAIPHTSAAKAGLSSIAGKITGAGGMVSQAMGQFTNPQVQLIYQGIGLRSFQFTFALTPKSSQEAETIKQIIDSFAFYSAPGLAGASVNQAGQYLTPPQLFKIKMVFTGSNGIGGTLNNIFSTAMNNIGLGFLNSTDVTSTISNAQNAKIMTINECVLDNVIIDYAPNGWAAYNDGYPIQTNLTLQFKETEIITKQKWAGNSVSKNFAQQQDVNSAEQSLTDAMTGTAYKDYGDTTY